MAWCRPGDKPSSELMVVSLLTHICLTRLQWDNRYIEATLDYLDRYGDCWYIGKVSSGCKNLIPNRQIIKYCLHYYRVNPLGPITHIIPVLKQPVVIPSAPVFRRRQVFVRSQRGHEALGWVAIIIGCHSTRHEARDIGKINCRTISQAVTWSREATCH